MPLFSASIRAVIASAVLMISASAQAADTIEHFVLQRAIDEATAAGKLDGSVTFYLSGTGPQGQVISTDVISNKRSNAFGKSNDKACIWTAQSALISLQTAAKQAGANAVTNIVSYFRKNEYRDKQNFECHVGAIMSAVTLRGDLVRVGK